MANYLGPYSFETDVIFDGSTLSVSVNLKQWVTDNGFVGNPAAIIGFSALDRYSSPISGATASLSGSVLTITIPSVPANGWNSISASLGF